MAKSNKALIFETLNEVKTLQNVREEDGFIHLKGVFGVCGVKNNNQRIYVKENYKKMVESMKDRITKSPIPGELEHPQSMNINLENISHKIVDISINEEGVVSGEIVLLNTEKGKQAQAIVEGGLPLFISSRAQGTVDKQSGVVTLETLQTYDLVGSPGFSQARLHLSENQMAESLCESVYYIAEKEDETEEKKEEKEIKEKKEEMDNEILKKLQEELEELKGKVEYLEEENKNLQEQLDEKESFSLDTLSEGIQNWIVKEFAPEIQNWITEQYSSQIEKWVVEEFSPEIEKWITEQYSPEVERWIVEEYSDTVQKWLMEEMKQDFVKEVDTKIEEGLQNNKTHKLSMIDTLLEDLEHQVREEKKPLFGRSQMIPENKTEGGNEPKFLQLMPQSTRVKWNMASDEVKESIMRRAKLYSLNEEQAILSFWQKVDGEFEGKKGVKSLYEGLENIMDEREKNLRMSLRRYHNRHNL